MSVQACGMDAEPIQIFINNDANLSGSLLITSGRGAAAHHDDKTPSAFRRLFNEIFKFLEKDRINPFLGSDNRTADRKDKNSGFGSHKTRNAGKILNHRAQKTIKKTRRARQGERSSVSSPSRTVSENRSLISRILFSTCDR